MFCSRIAESKKRTKTQQYFSITFEFMALTEKGKIGQEESAVGTDEEGLVSKAGTRRNQRVDLFAEYQTVFDDNNNMKFHSTV